MNIKRFVVIGVASIALMGAKKDNRLLHMASSEYLGPKHVKEKLFDLDLVDLDNKDIILLDYAGKGKTTVLAFFSEICPPCKLEIEAYNELYEKWQKEYNAEVIVICVDGQDKMLKFKQEVKANNYKFKTFWDNRQEAQGVLKIDQLPLTLIIDKEGYIVSRHNSFKKDRDIPFLENKLSQLK